MFGFLVWIAVAGLSLSAIMTGAYWAQRLTGKSGWVDAIWSFGTGAVGAASALVPMAGETWPTGRQTMTAVLALAWSLRLGGHIASRTLKGGDDPRYQALREEWGADFPRRFFWFLQIQAGAALLLTLSIFLASRNPSPFPGLGDALGAAILVIAVIGEGIADAQLRRFRADPRRRGGVCDSGLWGLSRHPNYFFEWLGWLAYPIIAIGAPPADLSGAFALVAPIFMYWLLVHVSGVPPLEAHMARTRGAAFAAYQHRVNAFFPGPNRGKWRPGRNADR
jgi:steroid 5-alpha reductase family enzyme